LFPRVGFIVTNLATSSRVLVRFYNKRGTLSLTSLQQRLVKTGGRLIKHARYYWLLLAESHLTRRLFGGMPGSRALPSPAGYGGLQSATDFGDEIGRQRDKCLITRSEKRRRFQVFMPTRGRAGTWRRNGKAPPASNPNSNFGFAKPGAGATVNQN
jgi:hypothetical protein